MRASSESNKFIKELDGINPNEINSRLSKSGSDITVEEIEDFEKALRLFLLPGTIDITNWKSSAIRILLIVAKEKDIQISMKRGPRTISPLHYPESEGFLSFMVNGIINEPW